MIKENDKPKKKKGSIVKKIIIGILAAICLAGFAAGIKEGVTAYINKQNGIGKVVDSYKGVDVHYNGEDYPKSYGKHYSWDLYYYGYKWQCVEYVKRFYKDAKDHRMPNGYGHAKDFFDENVKQGELNKDRGLLQFRNNDNEKPAPDDLMIFTDTTYGHVVIVTEVGDDYIEYIEQNEGQKTREKLHYEYKDGVYNIGIGDERKPAGWLRLE